MGGFKKGENFYVKKVEMKLERDSVWAIKIPLQYPIKSNKVKVFEWNGNDYKGPPIIVGKFANQFQCSIILH